MKAKFPVIISLKLLISLGRNFNSIINPLNICLHYPNWFCCFRNIMVHKNRVPIRGFGYTGMAVCHVPGWAISGPARDSPVLLSEILLSEKFRWSESWFLMSSPLWIYHMQSFSGVFGWIFCYAPGTCQCKCFCRAYQEGEISKYLIIQIAKPLLTCFSQEIDVAAGVFCHRALSAFFINSDLWRAGGYTMPETGSGILNKLKSTVLNSSGAEPDITGRFIGSICHPDDW